ncbi:hypothetical protein [Oryzobacter telluris]|uniref:hypothetical protein n=1 Tax=Oryzobacter telluris TaxID=3149179 RepID=UPI00370D6A6F
MLVGWVLASSTSAQADDHRLLADVVQTVERVAPAVAPEPVEAAVGTTAAVVEKSVGGAASAVQRTVAATPVAPVGHVATAPVRAVMATVRTVATTVTTHVVRPLVETVTHAVDPVVDTPQLPGVDLPVVPGLDPGTGGPAPVPAPTDGSLGERVTESGHPAVGDTTVATGSRVAPLFGSRAGVGVADPGSVPSDPEPAVPWPGVDLSGLVPSSPSGSTLALSLAMMVLAMVLVRPEYRCAAARLAVAVPCPGPAADPGSRPD